MRTFYVDLDRSPLELRQGIEHLSRKLNLAFSEKQSPEIVFCPGGEGVSVSEAQGTISISYNEPNDAFRGLGLLNATEGYSWKNIKINQKRHMRKTWVMYDASRNAVLNGQSVKEWLSFLALAGINGLMFYTEDTYRVPDEPLFGYMRGGYSESEMIEFDDYAHSLGIELVPCIQTLAHMQRVLRYEAYESLRDTPSVMLCGEDQTYAFVEKLIKAASGPLRSRRIHIGMDEAWDLGRGKYLDINGKMPGFEIISDHLERVLSIVHSLGLRPMMWGDMYFRVLSPTHDYFDTSIQIGEKTKSKIPKDVDLIYWDYYHQDRAIYDGMIGKYSEMGKAPIFAPGIWSWNRFWPAYSYAESTMFTGIKNCLQHGVPEVLVTMWGDDGTECDMFAALPLLQLASDMVFNGELCHETTRKNLQGNLGISFDDWALGQSIDRPPFLPPDGISNVSKCLLWEDPLHGLFQPQLDGHRLNDFYANLASSFEILIEKPENDRLRLPFLVSKVLSSKADLPSEILQAYRSRDRSELERICTSVLPNLIESVRDLNRYHRQLWHSNYKSFGWEVLERRYGGLLGSFENLIFRLDAYLSGTEQYLTELDEARTKMYDFGNGKSQILCHWQVVSTGEINHG